MAFKPNYNQQRAERKRAKEAKKQEKLQRQEAEVARRRAAQDDGPDSGETDSGAPDDPQADKRDD